jgi:hypothetical protein
MAVLLFRRAARRGRWRRWDGASATFSTPGNALSSSDLHLAVTDRNTIRRAVAGDDASFADASAMPDRS